MKRDPFKEYIKESEPSKRDKGYAWHTAIGLQAVDGLRTSEYLEVFLRNLLLNENHPLHNRTLHISGTFKETEKANIDVEKANIGKEKANVEAVFTAKTKAHIQMLREALGPQNIFGRSDVQRVLGLKPTRSSELLREMAEHGIIEPVTGHGKGKYRFWQREI